MLHGRPEGRESAVIRHFSTLYVLGLGRMRYRFWDQHFGIEALGLFVGIRELGLGVEDISFGNLIANQA